MKRIEQTLTARQRSRRQFLRGAGVALALPWMESLPLLGVQVAKVTAANKPPLRFACIYFSNGVEPIHWWAKGSGASMMAKVPIMEKGSAKLGMTVAERLRRKRKITITTSPNVKTIVNCTSCSA